MTTLPFAGVHVPLLLLDYHVSVRSVLIGIAGWLILGIVVRLLHVLVDFDLRRPATCHER